jgi:hypothetical protein
MLLGKNALKKWCGQMPFVKDNVKALLAGGPLL